MAKPTDTQINRKADDLIGIPALDDYQQGVLEALLWVLGDGDEPSTEHAED